MKRDKEQNLAKKGGKFKLAYFLPTDTIGTINQALILDNFT